VSAAELSSEDLRVALEQASLDMIRQKDILRDLDATIGDGDLGVTVELGCRAVADGLSALADANISMLLTRSGMNFNRAASSTFGVLVTTAFLEAGKQVAGRKTIGLAELAKMVRAIADGIQRRGKAQVGDKTVLDAIVPAALALEQASESGLPLEQALGAAVEAAQAGMRSTIPLKSKYGRAAWFGEKSVGIQDPGATAVYLFAAPLVRHLRGRLSTR